MNKLLLLLSVAALLAGCQATEPTVPPEPGEEPCVDFPPPPMLGYEPYLTYPYRRNPRYNPANPDEISLLVMDVDTSTAGVIGETTHAYLADTRTGRQRLLLTDVQTGPAWNGRGWLVMGRLNGELWKCKSNGDSLTRLTNNRHYNSDAAWSPDGRRIAYKQIGNTNNAHGIVVCDAVGRMEQFIPDAQIRMNSTIAWSPDGQRLAFVSGLNRPTDQPALSIYDLAQQRLTQLVPLMQHTYTVYSISWLPNGRDIVWSDVQQGVMLTNEATGHTRVLRANCPGGSRFFPTVYPSPDGQRLIMQRGEARAHGNRMVGTAILETTDLNGGSIRRLPF